MTAKYDNTDGRLRGRALQTRRLRMWSIDPCCAICRRLTNYPDGFQLDHKEALHKSKDDSEENTQVLCIECHDAKTQKDMGNRERVAIGADGWPSR